MIRIIRPLSKHRNKLLTALVCSSALIIGSRYPLIFNQIPKLNTIRMSSSLQPPQQPPSWNHTVEQILLETDEIIKRSKAVYDNVGSLLVESVSIANALKPVTELENIESLQSNQLTFYQHVSSNKQLRDASTELSEKLENYSIEASLREDVYKNFHRLYELTKDLESVDLESKRFIEKTNKAFERNGLLLPEESRLRIKELQQELSKISITFNKNLGEQVEFLLFTREELDGLPDEIIEQFEVVDSDGVKKYKVTFKYPDIIPTLKYAKNSDTRKKAFLGDQNKVPQNAQLMKDAVKLRLELAQILGYDTYADYVLEDRMAKNSKTVMDFLNDLQKKLTPLGLKDKETLIELKKKDLLARGILTSDNEELYIWDNNFYNNMLLETEYKIDAQKISEYFPMESTVAKMLEIFSQLFNLKFEEISHESSLYSTWHPDVKQFTVWKLDNNTTEFVGYLYFDLFPREGKYGHAANFGIAPSYIKLDGSRSYPVTALVCNFSKPTKTKPSLLKHNEVTTFFHELGHGIHDLLGVTKYAKFSGTSVSWDFVECPSQILEYWTWEKEQLKFLSSHYLDPSVKLPDELIDSLSHSKHVNGGLFNLRQLFFGFFDMKLHTSKPGSDIDITQLWNEIRQDVSLVANGDTVSTGYGSFAHLLGGYAAGYYGYMWSQVFATDIFYSKFKLDPMNRQNGLLYRDIILSPGGSRDNMDTLVELLGRKPNSDAFLKELGVN